MSRPSFFTELKRRNVLRAGVLYIGAIWALAQGISQLGPSLGLPDWATRWFLVAGVVGFPFWLIFSWLYELTPQGFKRESEVPVDASITRTTGRKLDFAIIGVLALAVVMLLTNQFMSHKEANTAPDKSIAVLPLVNAGGNRDEQFFSDGLSENLIIALSQFDGLTVIGRNSSFQFRDSKDDSKAIGMKLGVATLLEGSVQHAGDIVRVSAELISAASGRTLWSQQYDRPYKDLFALQDDVTRAVATALKAKLLATGDAAIQTDRPPGGNLDAYSAYLRGRSHEDLSTEADLRQAIAQYATATRIDPAYALAWAALSRSEAWLAGEFLGGTEANELNAQARKASDTALRLEPNLAAAHDARGELLSAVDFDWDGAEAEYRRALQIAPNTNEAMESLGLLLAARGQPEQAIVQTRQALATDPMRAVTYRLLSRYLNGLGRFDESEQAIRKAIELQPTKNVFEAGLVEVEVLRGDATAALAAAERTLPGSWQDFAFALARQLGGDRAAADAALQALIDRRAVEMAYQIAQVQALRRDADKAFEWLDRALANRDPGIQFLLVDPFLLRYRNDPRFAAFCAKIGLSPTTTAKAMP
jgi:TolB-like protein/Tfp pilus assembly protein PilF